MKNFTESQQNAVNFSGSNAVVLAVAGAGKTTVMTHRAARLKNSKVLLLTFTKKAAQQMHDRLRALLNEEPRAEIRTFHSWCYAFLRRVDPRFAAADCLMTEQDEWRLTTWAEAIIKSLRLPRTTKPAEIISKIDSIKSKGCFPARINDAADPICGQLDDEAREMYSLWWSHQSKFGKFDYSDLITHTLEKLRSDSRVRSTTAVSYDYVMVDEYQDTDPGQEMILELICSCPKPTVGKPIRGAEIMVVGDDDQSIYSFRNAIPKFIIDFQKKWNAATFFLEENFRSHEQILSTANRLIGKNITRVKKTLKPIVGKDGIVSYVEPDDEGGYIATRVLEYCQDKRYSDVAVLYRTNAQSCLLESAFTDLGIPYECDGNQREGFYGIPEVKTLLSYLRLVHDNTNFEALQYVWNRPTRFLTRDDLLKAKRSCGSDSVIDILENAAQGAGRNSWKVNGLRGIIQNLSGSKTQPVERILATLRGALEYSHWLKELSDKGRRNLSDMEACVDHMAKDAKNYPTLPRYLAHVDLMIENAKNKKRDDAVRLMTLHRAKGLEFPCVFFSGFNKSYVPHPRGEVEEERRLAYVGITRAIKHLTILGKSTDVSPFFPDLGLPVADEKH